MAEHSELIFLVETFPEINPNNYDHDDVVALNDWGILATAEITKISGERDALVKALRAALNFIENTESELGIQLSSGETAREALALASQDRQSEVQS